MNFIEHKKLSDMYSSEDITPLDNIEEIEDLICIINSLNDKEIFLKKLKKKRENQVNEAIEKINIKREKLKSIIQYTLEKDNRKSLSFPGIGKVSIRSAKGNWKVKDKEGLLDYLNDCIEPEEFDKITKFDRSFIKKELDNVLGKLSKSVLEDISKFAEKQEGVTSLTVSAEEGMDLVEDEPEEKFVITSDDLDSLDL